METIKTLEEALKQVYLLPVRNKINTDDKLLSKIEHTTEDVYGKEIIRIDNDNSLIKKELKNIYSKVSFTEKALKSCGNCVGVFVNLANSEIETCCANAVKEIRNLFVNELSHDLGIKLTWNKIKPILNNLVDEDFEHIKQHQLCDFLWLEDDKGILRKTGELYEATLVKYCNFTFDRIILDKIKSMLEE